MAENDNSMGVKEVAAGAVAGAAGFAGTAAAKSAYLMKGTKVEDGIVYTDAVVKAEDELKKITGGTLKGGDKSHVKGKWTEAWEAVENALKPAQNATPEQTEALRNQSGLLDEVKQSVKSAHFGIDADPAAFAEEIVKALKNKKDGSGKILEEATQLIEKVKPVTEAGKAYEKAYEAVSKVGQMAAKSHDAKWTTRIIAAAEHSPTTVAFATAGATLAGALIANQMFRGNQAEQLAGDASQGRA